MPGGDLDRTGGISAAQTCPISLVESKIPLTWWKTFKSSSTVSIVELFSQHFREPPEMIETRAYVNYK
jgi:hypothetical protein